MATSLEVTQLEAEIIITALTPMELWLNNTTGMALQWAHTKNLMEKIANHFNFNLKEWKPDTDTSEQQQTTPSEN